MIIRCITLLVPLVLLVTPVQAGEITASVYSDAYDATGAPIDANGMIAAHKTLPLGTKLTLYHGHRSVVVTIMDRGPFVPGRTLDLSPSASKVLGCYDLCRVRVEPWPPLPKPRDVLGTVGEDAAD